MPKANLRGVVLMLTRPAPSLARRARLAGLFNRCQHLSTTPVHTKYFSQGQSCRSFRWGTHPSVGVSRSCSHRGLVSPTLHSLNPARARLCPDHAQAMPRRCPDAGVGSTNLRTNLRTSLRSGPARCEASDSIARRTIASGVLPRCTPLVFAANGRVFSVFRSFSGPHACPAPRRRRDMPATDARELRSRHAQPVSPASCRQFAAQCDRAARQRSPKPLA